MAAPVLSSGIVVSGDTTSAPLTADMNMYQTVPTSQTGPLSWSLTNAATGVTIDTSTGVLTVAQGVGIYTTGTVQLRVQNTQAKSSTQTLTLNTARSLQLQIGASGALADAGNVANVVTNTGSLTTIADVDAPGRYDVVFNGTGYLTTAYGPALAGDFTVQAVFKITASCPTYASVLHMIGDLMLHVGNARVLYFRMDPAEGTYLNLGVTIVAGTWYRFTAQRIGTAVTVYVNGVSKGTLTSNRTVNAGLAGVRIGWGKQLTTTMLFAGAIRDVLIYAGSPPAGFVV